MQPEVPVLSVTDLAGVEVLDMRPPRRGLGLLEVHDRARSGYDRARLQRASWAFTTRRVRRGAASMILAPKSRPSVGDLVLARIDALGHHGGLQLVNGRQRQLFPGNEIVVVYGNRYAPNQFEAVVPDTMGPCHLVAAGGIAARARSWHAKITRGPTAITPIGLVADAHGAVMNLRAFTLEPVAPPRGLRPTVLAVVGTSMDAGKTQTCVHLVRGLIAAGSRVGYAKITGTGAGGDFWSLSDAGADPVVDFTDLGVPSTYLLATDEVEATMVGLVNYVAFTGVDAMVLEIADGILQRETAALVSGAVFGRLVDGVVLAAQDSMGALAGFQWLRERATPLLALSGLLTAAPLQIVEAGEATGLPVYDRDALATVDVALDLLTQARHHHDDRLSALKVG